MEIEEFKEREI